MKIRVLSSGIVSHYGIGSLGGILSSQLIATAEGGSSHPVALVDRNAQELARWSKEPRMRRASPISYYMIEATSQALSAIPDVDLSRVGIVATFFLGCLMYSVKFYRQIHLEGRRFGSPVLFPETVFNSPLSHVVSVLGIGGPAYSQIGDKSCWVTGLRTAESWLRNGSADHVVVLGAEEFDPMALDAFHAAGLIKKEMVVGEGAGAVLLSSSGDGDQGIFIDKIVDGYGFSDKSGAAKAATSCLNQFPKEAPLLSTATSWTQAVELKVSHGRPMVRVGNHVCEAFTARAGWDTFLGVQSMDEKKLNSLIIPYWGLSQQFGAVYLVR
jgi:hypothetical protein